TVARADTAVVDHVVEPLVAVHGGADRTDDLARRVLALHTGHRLKVRFRIGRGTAVIGVDTNPVHLPAAQHLVLADDRNIVLGLAADNARIAPDAGIDVDRHAPLVAFVLAIRIERDCPRR